MFIKLLGIILCILFIFFLLRYQIIFKNGFLNLFKQFNTLNNNVSVKDQSLLQILKRSEAKKIDIFKQNCFTDSFLDFFIYDKKLILKKNNFSKLSQRKIMNFKSFQLGCFTPSLFLKKDMFFILSNCKNFQRFVQLEFNQHFLSLRFLSKRQKT